MTKTEIAKLNLDEVFGIADLAPELVRDEGFRRHELAVNRIARLEQALTRAYLARHEANAMINIGMAEITKQS